MIAFSYMMDNMPAYGDNIIDDRIGFEGNNASLNQKPSLGLSIEDVSGEKSNVSNSNSSVQQKLPKNPDDLLSQGWKEVTEPRMAANSNRRVCSNPNTGEILEFDKAVPGANGFKGKDHYHRANPNSTNKREAYLDKDGNPVVDGAKASHLLPYDPENIE